MTTTANLALTLIETNQSQKEVTANTAISGLDAAMTAWTTIDVDDGSNAIAAADVRGNQFLLLSAGSPGLTGPIDVVLPAIKRLLVIRNESGDTATISCSGAASGAEEVELATDTHAIVYNDGTQVWRLTNDASVLVEAFTDLSDAPANYSGAGGKLLAVNSGATAVEFIMHKQAIQVAVGDEATALTTGTAKVTFRMPYAFTLTAVRASVGTAPTGADLKVDVNVTGVGSVLSTVITIEATEKSSVDATTQPVISTSSIADDAEVTIDIDQVGSTVAGAGLKVTLVGRPT